MGKIHLLDCTLRDGGYVNDWRFGEKAIKGICKKIANTGIEMCEVGFIKGDKLDKDCSVFPDTDSMKEFIAPKSPHMMYVGMYDLSAPVPMDRIAPRDESSIDGIRVIFKKSKMKEAFEVCKQIKELGYWLSVNFVGTDMYSDEEFIHGIELFNTIQPECMSIVDSFGLIKRKQFLRLVYIADNNMNPGITLGYHAHNNLQLALGNAQSLVEMNLKRDLCVDACVFGMGRGAGNLNLELFAEYMNENYDTNYQIEPMLEIMDEYLSEIYKSKFWGYSLPLYLSASAGCHPNYAIYLGEKDTLPVKAFNKLLRGIPDHDKAVYSKDKAEHYYRAYQENYVDDKGALEEIGKAFAGRPVVLLAPGQSLAQYQSEVERVIKEKNAVVVAVNFDGGSFAPEFVFSSHMKRFSKVVRRPECKYITTSNMKEVHDTDYVVNFASYASEKADIIDNSGLMLLRLLSAMGMKEVWIAGMDGYSGFSNQDYFDQRLVYDFSKEAGSRNERISEELVDINKKMKLNFITPTCYNV